MLGNVRKSGRKFLFAGKGMSVQTGRYLFEAMLVGAVTGLAVVLFKCLIDCAQYWYGSLASRREEFWLNPVRWIMAVLPVLGALAGHLLIRKFDKLENARGTNSAIDAFHKKSGYITSTVIPVKPVASVLTVGTGGSAGYEGPVTLLGSAIGSAIARLMKLSPRARRILMASGLSAGIAALFQVPLAGAIFGFEIFYSSSDIEDETVLPCFIASSLSYAIYSFFVGPSAWQPLFELDSRYAFSNSLRLFPYFILALAVTFASRFYISFFRATEKAFCDSRIPVSAKVAIGGLVTGAIGFFFPDILGTGYSIIEGCLNMDASGFAGIRRLTAVSLFVLFALKVVATTFTVGSGGSGGLFAPALACGSALGAAVGVIMKAVMPESIGITPQAFALVGMAGFMASTMRTPLTAIVMVSEMTGNNLLLMPAMWVCGISFWLNNGWTLYRSQVHRQESSPKKD